MRIKRQVEAKWRRKQGEEEAEEEGGVEQRPSE